MRTASSGTTSSSIKLSWNSEDGATYYNIQYDDGTGWTSEGGAIYERQHTVSGLSPNTTYHFRVKAISRSSSSEWSSTVSGKTKIGKPSVIAAKSGSAVSLTVGRVEGADYYSVFYGTSADWKASTYYGLASISTEAGNSFITKVTKTFTTGTTYYFFVTAHDSSGDSATGVSQPLTF